jgi:hypothetical protein
VIFILNFFGENKDFHLYLDLWIVHHDHGVHFEGVICKIYNKIENKRELIAIVNMEHNRIFSLILRPTRDVALKVDVGDLS